MKKEEKKKDIGKKIAKECSEKIDKVKKAAKKKMKPEKAKKAPKKKEEPKEKEKKVYIESSGWANYNLHMLNRNKATFNPDIEYVKRICSLRMADKKDTFFNTLMKDLMDSRFDPSLDMLLHTMVFVSNDEVNYGQEVETVSNENSTGIVYRPIQYKVKNLPDDCRFFYCPKCLTYFVRVPYGKNFVMFELFTGKPLKDYLVWHAAEYEMEPSTVKAFKELDAEPLALLFSANMECTER